jgi:trehalose 6-phosphate phosphatase
VTGTVLPEQLRVALAELARTPRLLVTVDFDGTLAPIVADPAAARPLAAAVTPLLGLAGLDGTTVAVVSGRARADLAVLSGLPPQVWLVGSHGAEYGPGGISGLDTDLLERVHAELRRITGGRDGVTLEAKPASVAVHVRRAGPEVGARVLSEVREGPATWDGVRVTNGKAVIELSVVDTDKGAALDALRQRAEATGVVFLGDDQTDENAFRRLRTTDVGIKVGPGDTTAAYRVPDPEAVAEVLDALLAARAR